MNSGTSPALGAGYGFTAPHSGPRCRHCRLDANAVTRRAPSRR